MLLLVGVPLWLLVAVDGPGPYAAGLVLAALVSAPGVLVAAVVLVHRGVQLARRRPDPRLPVLFKAAVAVHTLAVLALPGHVLAASALESHQADSLVASVTKDVDACAREAMTAYPREGEFAPVEMYQQPTALARSRSAELATAAIACLHGRRRDLENCLEYTPVCTVITGQRFPDRGELVLGMVPALVAEHSRLTEDAKRRGVAPPAALDPEWLQSPGPPVLFSR